MHFRFEKNVRPSCVVAVVAMQVEEDAIVEILGDSENWVVSHQLRITARIFKRQNHSLILVRSGIGVANAAATVALVTESRKVDGILLFGVAGAISEQLNIGDLVIATSVIQHDSLFSGENGFELMAPGFPFVSAALAELETPICKLDSSFRDWLRPLLMKNEHIVWHEGALLSGSEFVGSGARKLELALRHPGAIAVEMEAAGIAVIARKAKLPFAVIKTVADRLNPDHSVFTDFNAFVRKASDNAAQILKIVWEDWTDSGKTEAT